MSEIPVSVDKNCFDIASAHTEMKESYPQRGAL